MLGRQAVKISGQRQHQRDFHDFGRLQLNNAKVDPALRAQAGGAVQIDGNDQQQRGAIDPVGAAKPVTHIDQPRRDHRHQGDREARHLARRPGLQIAVRGRIQHGDADARDRGDQQHQSPLDCADLIREGEFGSADVRGKARHPLQPRGTIAANDGAGAGISGGIASDTKSDCGMRRAGSRRCTSISTSRQIGAATADPPPPVSPPCSMTTAQT